MVNFTKVAAGVLMATALALCVLAWTLSRRPPAAPPVAASVSLAPMYPIVVAARLLPAGQPIKTGALRVVRMPVHPSGAYADASFLADRVPLADIGIDTPVLESQLSSGFAEQVAPGERAVAVRVDEASAAGGRVRPGNFVDVFFTLKRDGTSAGPGGNAEITHSQSRLLLSRIRVLAFGSTASGAGNPNEYGALAHTAVLAVPTADVDRLVLAENAGHLLLALRNPHDEEVVDPTMLAALPSVLKTTTHTPNGDMAPEARAAAGVSLGALSGSEGGTRSATPAAPHSGAHGGGGIEVIRGGHETLAN
jgi:pilus assembly protein CpaB